MWPPCPKFSTQILGVEESCEVGLHCAGSSSQCNRLLNIDKPGMEELHGRARVADRDQHKYYDIVGSLPLELVAHVAEYQDGADIVRSQSVRMSHMTNSFAVIQCRSLVLTPKSV